MLLKLRQVDGDDDVEPVNDLAVGSDRDLVPPSPRLDLSSHSESLEAAGTIPDAVWRKVRCLPDPAASTISPRTGRILGVSEDCCGLDRWWQATVQ